MVALLDTASDPLSIFPTNRIHFGQSLVVCAVLNYYNDCRGDIKLVAVDIYK